MRRIISCSIVTALAATGALVAGPGSSGAAPSAGSTATVSSGGYVVVYRAGASAAAARRAIASSGGTIVQENRSLGYAFVRSSSDQFRSAAAEADRKSVV